MHFSLCVQATFIENILHCDVTYWNTWASCNWRLNQDEKNIQMDAAQIISIMANLRQKKIDPELVNVDNPIDTKRQTY